MESEVRRVEFWCKSLAGFGLLKGKPDILGTTAILKSKEIRKDFYINSTLHTPHSPPGTFLAPLSSHFQGSRRSPFTSQAHSANAAMGSSEWESE